MKIRALRLVASILLLVGASTVAFAQDRSQGLDPEHTLIMQLEGGKVVIELYPDIAPNHVARVKELVREGFYDGLKWFRVIENYIAQTGDPRGNGTGGTGKTIKAEFSKTPHELGTVSMARKSDPDSADSQFFITMGRFEQLDGQYTVFGKVVSGMEFVTNIKAASAEQKGIVEDPDRVVSIRVLADIEKAENKISSLLESLEDPENTLILELRSGPVAIKLRTDKAPKHAARIKKLARDGFYDGLTFHRVIDGYFAQGGDPKGDGTGGTGITIPAEINDLKHVRGAVSMARKKSMDSADSQFFILTGDIPTYDGQFTVFGEVISGIEYVDEIKKGNRKKNGRVAHPDSMISMRVASDIIAAEKKAKQIAQQLSSIGDAENTLIMQMPAGPVVIRMLPDVAPKHVARIKELVRKGFYDGLAFFRVIDGLIAQTGDPTNNGRGGSGESIPAEFSDLPMKRGTVAMALRGNDPDSADSQFFFVYDEAPQFQGRFTIWGEVVEGMELIDNVKKGTRRTNGRVSNPDRLITIQVAADII
jgi:peptidylprolyl isomerase